MVTRHTITRGFVLLLLLSLTGTAEAGKRYKVTVDTVPTGAKIYLETRHADPIGNTPQTFRLEPGEYTFILEMEGYEPLSRKVKIKHGAKLTYTLTRKSEPARFTIESAPGAGVDGATVKINGKDVGKVPVPLSLSKGRYLVEVNKEGFKQWRKWISVEQGEKKTLAVTLVSAKPQTGTLLVHSSAPGAVIYISGRKVDRAPALIQKLKVGKHVVEARAKGYQTKSVEAQVEAGKSTKVTINLELTSAAKALGGGTLQILASPRRVEIFIDGKSRGLAPVKASGLVPGSHLVEGRKDGHVTVEKTVKIIKGEFKTLKLALKEVVPPKKSGALRVISPLGRVLVFLDGNMVGKTPLLRHQIIPGPHFVTARKKGYEDLVQTVEIKPGKIVELQVVLKKSRAPASVPASQPGAGSKDKPDETTRRAFGLSSYGAQGVGPWNFALDVSLGFAHIFETRLTAGLFYKPYLGLDAGVTFRTYGAMTEFGLHSKWRVLHKQPFAVALLFDLGGGGGPSSRNTFYTNIGATASWWYKRYLTVSARLYFNIYSDRLCPDKTNDDDLMVCKLNGDWPSTLKEDEDSPLDRFSGLRVFLAGLIEVPLPLTGWFKDRLNLFGMFEWAPGTPRWAYTKYFVDLMPVNDVGLYGRIGATLKF